MISPRELVDFDVLNLHHRAHAMYFFKNMRWHKDAPRFNVGEEHLTVPGLIKDRMLEMYFEFDNAREVLKTLSVT